MADVEPQPPLFGDDDEIIEKDNDSEDLFTSAAEVGSVCGLYTKCLQVESVH